MFLNINIFKIFIQILIIISVFILLITTNVKLVINNMKFYDYEFSKYEISKKTGIDQKELISVAKQIKDYFNNDEKFLKVSIWKNNVKIENLFNSKEILHMVDVKKLIRLVYIFQSISFIFLISYLLIGFYLLKTKIFLIFNKLLFISSITIIIIIITVGLISFIGFEKVFLIFHQISFTNDLWQLNPRKDYLIAIFPEGFFFETTMLIAFLTLIECLFIFCITKLLKNSSNYAKLNKVMLI
ncbi:MAG: TIGR01906 family membrane protein [Chloroflexi bacterium]|nr:TIGR01906 family membrane protein [Chloroflexota bacterium]